MGWLREYAPYAKKAPINNAKTTIGDTIHAELTRRAQRGQVERSGKGISLQGNGRADRDKGSAREPPSGAAVVMADVEHTGQEADWSRGVERQ